jgi:hypothetical protein
MTMKIPFKRDTAAALARTRSALSAAEAKVAELGRERAVALLASDGVDEVARIERAQLEQKQAIAIHRDRAAALEAELRREQHEQSERQREASIEVIRAKLAKRDRIAAELEASIKKTGELYFALIESGSVANDWPFPKPRPNFGIVDFEGIRREVGWALFSAGRPRGGRSLFPEATNAGLGVTGIHAIGVAESVASHSRALIETMRTAPLGDEEDDSSPVEGERIWHGLSRLGDGAEVITMTDAPNGPVADLLPQMSPEAATSKKNELFANQEWRNKYYNGDATARSEMDAIVRALTPAQPAPADPSSREQFIDWIRNYAEISEEVAEQIRSDRPVSAHEHRLAQQRKETMMRDKEWCKLYLDNDRDARTEMALVNIILSSRVRDPGQP